jgi:hypothetical protein
MPEATQVKYCFVLIYPVLAHLMNSTKLIISPMYHIKAVPFKKVSFHCFRKRYTKWIGGLSFLLLS